MDRRPSPIVRRVVTAALLLHFFAILTAVTSAPEPAYPPPQLAVWANQPLRPYLASTFMNSPYRFFAPNPGAPTVLWFRIQYEDKFVRWLEAPEPTESWLRAAYQRRLNLAMQPSQLVVPESGDGVRFRPTDVGEIVLASYARHVAKRHEHVDSAGQNVPVRSVGIYFVRHAARTPEQVRAGWEAKDLRTYQTSFAGAYRASGERSDQFRPYLEEQPIAFVAAGVLQVDVYPRLSQAAGTPPFPSDLSPPSPIRQLLARFPELLVPTRSGEDLKQHIEQLAGISSGKNLGGR